VSMECRRGGQGVTESQNPLRRGMSLYYSERSWGKIGASEDSTFPHDVTLHIFNFLGVAEGVVEYAVLLGVACSTGDEPL
jgi:hypothetical protein